MDLPADNCLAFEDTNNGLLSASPTGLKTVVTVNEYTKAQDFTGAKLVLSDLGNPETPFNVLAGDAGDATHFTVDLARQLCA